MQPGVYKKLLVAVGAVLAMKSYAAAAVVTVDASFQNGTNGYSGTFDRRIGNGELDGSTVDTDSSAYFLDGGSSTLGDAGEQQGLIRFDGIVGGNAIPANAFIIRASVDVLTTNNSNSQTGGAYNVYSLNRPFNSDSSYSGDFAANTPGIADDIGPIIGSFNRGQLGLPVSARIDQAVQAWVNGAANNGLGIRSDNGVDGWSFNTTGATTVVNRPKLSVTYSTSPALSQTYYRQGLNGYNGTVDAFINGYSGATVGNNVAGSTISEGFLDGSNGTDSFDQPYLLKFDNIDITAGSLYRAELTIQTGFSSGSADSGDIHSVHRILRPWDGTTTYESLDSDGVPELNQVSELVANGFIAAAEAQVDPNGDGGRQTIDITSIVQAWKDGAPNYGIYIGSTAGSNGWQIFSSGASDPTLAPELRIITEVPEPASLGLLGMGVVGVLARRRRLA